MPGIVVLAFLDLLIIWLPLFQYEIDKGELSVEYEQPGLKFPRDDRPRVAPLDFVCSAKREALPGRYENLVVKTAFFLRDSDRGPGRPVGGGLPGRYERAVRQRRLGGRTSAPFFVRARLSTLNVTRRRRLA